MSLPSPILEGFAAHQERDSHLPSSQAARRARDVHTGVCELICNIFFVRPSALNPCPVGNRVSKDESVFPVVIRDGQGKGSLPVKSDWPNSTSATPAPSEPGNHAAMKACDACISSFTINGRPDTRTVTIGTPALAMRRMQARSSGCRTASSRVWP